VNAIEASSVNVRTMVDGTLRLTVDIEPRHAIAAFTLFGSPGTALALAALRTKAEKEKPKGPPLHSQWLAMRCEEREFQTWMAVNWPDQRERSTNTPGLVRLVLGVLSRAEIDTDPVAFERFERLIRKPWAEHNKATA
jgi:hypothetical protein